LRDERGDGMKYQGSCHCGNVAFEVEGEIGGVISCNGSICRRNNLRCLEGIDLDSIAVTPFDGRSV
jgi:hypothetical protein